VGFSRPVRGKTMKKTILYVVVAVFVLLAVGAVPVPAHAYWRGSIWIGPVWVPGWGPGAYPYPYPYYQSPPVVVQQQPPVYQEQAPQEQPDYWYYCQGSQAYYPYVKECPGGWVKVVPSQAPPK